MAKTEVGKEICRLYSVLDLLRRQADFYNKKIKLCKRESNYFVFDPYTCYDYSPAGPERWDEELDLGYYEKMYAYVTFFQGALRTVEKEIRKIKRKIKELQRLQSPKNSG